METTTFEDFCNKVDESFVAIATMVEFTKTGNEDLINILSDNGK